LIVKTLSVAPHSQKGFGLAELMVTLTIMAVVLAAVFFTLNRSQRQTQRLTKVAEMRQMARTAVQLIERETRMAGSGWGRITVQGSNNGSAYSVMAVNPGYGSVATSDSVRLVGAWLANSTLTAVLTTASTAVSIASNSGFATNDLFLVTDGSHAHLFQCTGLSSTTGLLHANTSKYNVTGGTAFAGWPAGGYPIGANVYKLTVATYRYDSTSYKRPALVRQEVGGTAQIVAYNVNGFHVIYELQDGTWTRNPADMNQVNKVIPVVLTRVTDNRLTTLSDSVWAAVTPRTF
jgi:prepilin-type N-terminal cleavage/methylation domain-containing protein